MQGSDFGIDASLNPLSDNFRADGSGYFQVSLWAATDGAGFVALDSDDWGVFCPAGGALLAYVQNPTAGSLSLILTIHGIKRFKDSRCK